MNKISTFPILETDRLVLRQVTIADAPNLMSYLSNERVTKHMGIAPFTSVEDAVEEILWYQSIFQEKTGMRWGITLKEQQEVVGSCGFLNLKAQHYRSEIGFELSEELWGKGVASEALEAVISYGFDSLNLQRIEALIEPANFPSQKLIEKHGFYREGLLRSYEFTCGKFDDLYMYSLLKNDFDGH